MEGRRDDHNRQRKSHRKSRLGCRNCKLRRVKCDETRPSCRKCVDFGVSCNYNPQAPDLQIFVSETTKTKKPDTSSGIFNQQLRVMMVEAPPLPSPVLIADNDSTFQLDTQSVDRARRFQMRTVLSLGEGRTGVIQQKEITRLAYSHPYLMHLVQAMTAIHDRYLSAPLSTSPTVTEAYHWSQAAALVNKKLSGPIRFVDRDALWAAACLLGVIGFCSIEAATSEDMWPLKPPPSELEWLRMCEGKKTIWKLADPLRPDSCFRPVGDYLENDSPAPTPSQSDLEMAPAAFNLLYGLDDELSTPQNNPYFTAALGVISLMGDRFTLAKHFSLISHLEPEFKTLLKQKDPRALLLLAYWHARACHSRWWVVRRARTECQSICLFLERLPGDATMTVIVTHRLLDFPKTACGLMS